MGRSQCNGLFHGTLALRHLVTPRSRDGLTEGIGETPWQVAVAQTEVRPIATGKIEWRYR